MSYPDLLLLPLGFLCFLLWRNSRVFLFQTDILSRISIHDPRFWEHIERLNSVGYFTMFWQFWRPLRSFYPAEWLEELEHP